MTNKPKKKVTEKDLDKSIDDVQEYKKELLGEKKFNEGLLFGATIGFLGSFITTFVYDDIIKNSTNTFKYITLLLVILVFLLLYWGMQHSIDKTSKEINNSNNIINLFEGFKKLLREANKKKK